MPSALVMLICVLPCTSAPGAVHKGDAHILHDKRIGAGRSDRRNRACRFLQFVVEDERVEGDVALHAAPVQRTHHFGQLFEREADLGAR